jgi:hypothetical protein
MNVVVSYPIKFGTPNFKAAVLRVRFCASLEIDTNVS